MWRCEDVDLQVWRCEDVDQQVWGCEDVDQQMWGCGRCRSAGVRVWRCRSADVRLWRSRSAGVKVWRCRSADVKVWRCRSADVKVWRCRSADVKVWRCSITAAFLRRTLRRRSREKGNDSTFVESQLSLTPTASQQSATGSRWRLLQSQLAFSWFRNVWEDEKHTSLQHTCLPRLHSEVPLSYVKLFLGLTEDVLGLFKVNWRSILS